MKKLSIFIVSICLSAILQIRAQDYSIKYGKVTEDEVAMTSYSKDTTANAVVLYKQGTIYYDYRNNDFKVEYYYEHKIKILKTEGTDYANIIIPFYSDLKAGNSKESVSKIEAFAYNMENDKIIKTKMDKDYIFEERVSDKWKQIKFSIPAVKAGTVIEYRYKLTSDFYYQLPDWDIQQDIPVAYAKLEAKIPEYFKFTIDTRGYEPVKAEDFYENQNFMINLDGARQETVQCNCRKLIFTSEHVPALKDDNYVWCVNDFMSHVTFELNGIQFPFSTYKSFTSTWESIDNSLKESDYFGGYLNMRNPFKEEMKILSFNEMSQNEKIKSLFYFLKNKISWNGKYGISGNEVKKAIKNGTGTNAEFNFVLLSMLKDAGIRAHPILMSIRTMGRLPLSHPSLNKINTFILGVENTDSTMVYVDGSIQYGDVNILPPVLMVDRARFYNPGSKGFWIDLSKVGRNLINSITTATVDEAGNLSGKRQSSFTGIYAANYKSAFYQAKDSLDFIDKIQTEEEITIEKCIQTNMNKLSPRTTETIEFTKSVMATDDHIYLNPMLFPHITKNSFTQEERKLPVEFAFPYDMRLNTIITIPENYEVEEMPENMKFSMKNRAISCTYSVQVNGNQLIMNYIFQFNTIIYPVTNYQELKKFWELLVQKNTEQVVLKKKA